tara:strand:- start:166 stop:297 length:132 start_codon:yes stop_codon:yes gene_type:complete
MAINNIQAVGDDQQWKKETERVVKELQNQIAVLKAQVNSRGIS